ncbi:LIM/homeobox protein Lhx3-like isoform X2 [Littorina saxatilis]|uniref:LIM/homeobox protein Lhx3-like isoform X2 n=1 Tax=Littorina saxatilis TaxID=31220 RepID=UPI0038B64CD0
MDSADVEYLHHVNFQSAPSCNGCGQPIQDEFILRVQGHIWHAHCLSCAACQTSLTQTCYVRGTRVFCMMDFYRLFGASCAGCGEVIPPSDVVRRAHENIYHMKCFVCVVCSEPLHTGDEFYLRDDGRLICKADYQSVRDSNQQDKPDGSRHELQGQQTPLSPPSNHNSLAFTTQETDILQEIYRACPNPSHDILQQISRQHGLDATRVRVWFHLHRKEKQLRDCGTVYNRGSNLCSTDGMERAVPPPGGYPLPIVNEVSHASSGRLPTSSRSAVMCDMPFPVTSPLLPKQPCMWPMSDDLWRPDFVPPNVDLSPCDIKNGEVCGNRRGLPPPSPVCAAGGEFCYEKGNNCQQGHLQGQGDMSLSSWINC